MSDLADNEARRRMLTEFGTSFFVEAAAGTGKTSALVDRIVGPTHPIVPGQIVHCYFEPEEVLVISQ